MKVQEFSIREVADSLACVVVVVACSIFIGLGIDGEVKSILSIAVGYLFGKGLQKSGYIP
jgi:hypothetical protein